MDFREEEKNNTTPIEEEAKEHLAYFKQQEEQDVNKTKPKKNRSSFVKGIFGGMFGGAFIVALIALLLVNNMLPWTIDFNQNDQAVSAVTHDKNTNTITVNDAAHNDIINTATVQDVSKAVVGIINLRQQDMWSPSQEAGAGSGIIYKQEDGKAFVITNNHVVKDASEVQVQLYDGERVDAEVLGTDELTDLAVLAINDEKVTHVAKLGSSADLNIGDTVLAIGNPLGMDLSGSVTKGIISGVERAIEVDTTGDNQPDWIADVIQTDAAINPGNSGGALVNQHGEVIGINSMKIARQEVEGIGFAIPIDTALPIVEELETVGKVSRPFIGISSAPLNQVPAQYVEQMNLPKDVEDGIVIANVQANSPADQAGLKQFDVITKINDKEIKSMLDLRKYLYSEVKIGDKVTVEVYRDGQKANVELTLKTENAI